MVQFTDVHLDLEYAENEEVDCNLIVCCRKQNGFRNFPAEDRVLSGKWFSYGEMGCDIPERTFLSMVEKVKELSPDFVTWTGDIVPHDVWM